MKRIRRIQVNNYGPAYQINFTPKQFDDGLAHEFVRTFTDNPDKFPGTWFEVWRFDQESMTWEVIIGVPQ